MNTRVGEREPCPTAEQAFSVAGIPAGATRAKAPVPAVNRGGRSLVRPGKPGLQTTPERTRRPQVKGVRELGWGLGRPSCISKRNHLPANLFNTFAGNVLMESCSPIYSVISPRGFTADLEPGSGVGRRSITTCPRMRAPRADTQDTSGTTWAQ